MMRSAAVAPYQTLPKSVRPSLITNEDEPEKLEEGFFGSLGKIFLNNGSSVAEIFGGLFCGFRRKPLNYQIHQQYQQINRHSNAWPLQKSFVIPDDDEPPSIATKTPTARKIYPFMAQDIDRSRHFQPNSSYYGGWDGDYHHQQLQQMQHQQQQQQQQTRLQYQPQQQQMQQHHHRQYSSGPTTHFEKNCETNEIVFGAVQEHMDDVKLGSSRL